VKKRVDAFSGEETSAPIEPLKLFEKRGKAIRLGTRTEDWNQPEVGVLYRSVEGNSKFKVDPVANTRRANVKD
jgi:hypothetical protein